MAIVRVRPSGAFARSSAPFGFGGGFVPTPVEVVQTLAVWIFGLGSNDRFAGTWIDAVHASTQRVVIGFLIAAVVGIAIGGSLGGVIGMLVIIPLIAVGKSIATTVAEGVRNAATC